MLGAFFAEVADAENGGMQIDAILESGSIVLNDVTYDIADNAVFYGRDMQSRISLSDFKEGDRVVLIIDPDGKITHMWLSSE
jgi:hypothetical protein